MKLVIIVLFWYVLLLTTSTMVLATSIAFETACWVKMMSMPSMFSSFRQASSAVLYCSAPASPRTSIGLPLLQNEGRTLLSVSMVFRLRLASFPPFAIRASVAMTPGPPALVITAKLGPQGRGWVPNTSAALNKSSISSTRTMPARLNAAS